MDFAYSPKVEALRQKMLAFMDDHVVPANIPVASSSTPKACTRLRFWSR